MSNYTRLTISGSQRRLEVVVPSSETLGTLLPGFIELLGEPAGTVARPLTLVKPGGDQLALDRSAEQLQLADGTSVRLERLDAAPPPPAVIDFVDVAADTRDAHPDRWDASARHRAGLSAVALSTALAGWLLPWTATISATVLGSAVVIMALAAAVVGRSSAQIAAMLTAAALGAGGAAGLALASLWPVADQGPYVAGLVTVLAWSIAVGLGIGLGDKQRGAAMGAGFGGGIAALSMALLSAGLGQTQVAEIAIVLVVFGLGMLPWLALSSSGLTDLDDRVAGGTRISRGEALETVETAFAAMSWSVGALAVLLALSGSIAILGSDVWAWLVAGSAVIAVVLRARAFPLRRQVWALWSACGVMTVASAVEASGYGVAGVAAGTAAGIAPLAAFASLVEPRLHVRARLRGLGNTVESWAAVALLPLVVGGFGLYSHLLGLFGGS